MTEAGANAPQAAPAVTAGAAASMEGASGRHLIYLHGAIVQRRQSRRPKHPAFGVYELDRILDAFRQRGFAVEGEVRPRGTTVPGAADRVAARVRELRAAGVPADHVTVLGASMGAAIALRAAAELQDPDLRFAVLGTCLARAVARIEKDFGKPVQGEVLAIREANDEVTSPCPAWDPAKAPRGLAGREIVLHTGLRHGFLYRPLPEWVEPVTAWAEQGPAGAAGP